MKTKITLLLLLFSLFSFAQNFPGESVELLISKQIQVNDVSPSLQKYGYDGFYKDENLKKKYDCCESYNSKYKGLVNKVFKVISAEEYKNIIGVKKYKLKIENEETGLIYYDYDPRYSHKFPFTVIGGIDLPEDFYCKKIDVKVDKFENKQSYFTPYTSGVLLMKTVIDGNANIFLSINEPGKTLNVGKTGLTLLLENGKKISKPDAKIDVETNGSGGYVYNALILLTDEDIKLLLENNITDNRLYIYDGTISKEDAEVIREYLKCLTK